MIHDRMAIGTQFPGHGCIDDLTNKRSFDSEATSVIDVLGSFFCHFIHGCLYNQALTDVRSTGLGIKFFTVQLASHDLCDDKKNIQIPSLIQFGSTLGHLETRE